MTYMVTNSQRVAVPELALVYSDLYLVLNNNSEG